MMKKNGILFVFFIFFCSIFSYSEVFISTAEAAVMRQELVDYGKKFMGKPYVSGAIGPNSFDCSGYVFTISREAIGIQLPRTTRAMYSFCSDIDETEREAGDLVFFKTTSSGEVSHVGIYIGNSQFLHCASDGPNTGVILSSLRENYWKSHYFCTKRYLPASKSDLLSDSGSDSVSSVASAKEKDSSSTKKNSKKEHNIISRIVFDGNLCADWNFFTPSYIRLTWRGISSEMHVRYDGKIFRPGFGTIFRFDPTTGNFQLPVILSLTFGKYVRAYAGPVFSFGSAHLPSDNDYKIKQSIFPGIMGICWNTPSFKAGKTEICFIQDIHYTVFNKTNGAAMDPAKSLATGIVFSSGIRVSLPMKNFLH